jgi:hypothetical protein
MCGPVLSLVCVFAQSRALSRGPTLAKTDWQSTYDMQNRSRSFEREQAISTRFPECCKSQWTICRGAASLRRGTFRPVAASGMVMKTVLNQERATINDNDLPCSKSFLHQEQIGLRDLGCFADAANRETIAHAFE